MGPKVVLLIMIIVALNGGDSVAAQSPAVCGVNEEFAIDLQRCQNTCKFYGRKWDCTPNYYEPNGACYCKPGFARITEGGKCVSVKNNQNCIAQLPISEDSCTRPNEIYVEAVSMGTCDKSCLTYGCKLEHTPQPQFIWGPHCECQANYRRLKNGICVPIDDARCVAEYQPSQERCAAIGLIYKTNAPCQPGCNDKTYCPPASGACVCPPNKLAYITEEYDPATQWTVVWTGNTGQVVPSIPPKVSADACYSYQANCPASAPAPAP